MALNFPDSPTIGDEFTGGGFTWVWDGANWSKISTAVSGANDFALLVGASGNTTYVLDRTYTSGRYTIEFANGDTTYDIYAIATDGTYAGYTNGAVIEVTADFAEVVVLGAATSETILFTYQGTLTSPSSTGDVAVAGAFLSGTSETSLPDADDFTILTGGNFAADVAVAFIGQDAVVRAAKSVVRSSSTQLLATRPDDFPVAQSPYSVRVLNPGIPAPAGTNAHILSNAINAGTNPVWVTDGDLVYNAGAATPDITLVATDTEGSDIDYSVVSGTIPAGLTLDGETGVISGTFSGTASDGDTNSVTFRATDAGGNFLDKAFNFVANGAPVWTTAAGALDAATPDGAYSFQFAADTGLAGGSLSYSLQLGTLPTGLTLSTTGLISGTSANTSGDTFIFTVRVTDDLGLFSDREFSILIEEPGPNFMGITYQSGSNYQEVSIGSWVDLTGNVFSAFLSKDEDGLQFDLIFQKVSSLGELEFQKKYQLNSSQPYGKGFFDGTNIFLAVPSNTNSTIVIFKLNLDGTIAYQTRIYESYNDFPLINITSFSQHVDDSSKLFISIETNDYLGLILNKADGSYWDRVRGYPSSASNSINYFGAANSAYYYLGGLANIESGGDYSISLVLFNSGRSLVECFRIETGGTADYGIAMILSDANRPIIAMEFGGEGAVGLLKYNDQAATVPSYGKRAEKAGVALSGVYNQGMYDDAGNLYWLINTPGGFAVVKLAREGGSVIWQREANLSKAFAPKHIMVEGDSFYVSGQANNDHLVIKLPTSGDGLGTREVAYTSGGTATSLSMEYVAGALTFSSFTPSTFNASSALGSQYVPVNQTSSVAVETATIPYEKKGFTN